MIIKDILKKSHNQKFKRASVIIDSLDKHIKKMEGLIINNKSLLIKNKASITLLLCLTGARIGNEKSLNQTCNLKYNENFGKQVDAFGISTLRFKHLTLEDPDIIKLNYIGKKQVAQSYTIKNKILYDYLLLMDKINLEQNIFGNITNNEIRKFINKNISKKIVIKDLRTAIASLCFAKKVEEINLRDKPKTKKEFTAEFNEVLKEVAEQLGNTPGVVKSRYCSVTLFDNFFNIRSELLSEKVITGIKKQFKALKVTQNKSLSKKTENKI